MIKPPSAPLTKREWHLLYFRTPRLWPVWPFLALVRRRPGHEEELGVLVDALGAWGLTGRQATVVLCNLLLLPASPDALFALPNEVFGTADELADAGWLVD
jgi:hypothetical protein